ncbi:hypothetical protein [Streptomyces sp. NPDC046925]|uniref:hypothetical protein n=1 Tax=Streptomyces sp. NPDC046925 TaxID=3155375 RepID=UPI0033CD4B30
MSTPQSPFAQPSAAGAGDNFNPNELNGHLLLIYPGATKMVMTQSYGEKEAVAAEIHVLDVVDPATGHPPVLTNTLIFNAVLIGQLKGEGAKGGMVLGRLGQGANTKGNAPWLLMDYTPQDEQVARQYIATHPREQFTRPQTQQQAPAPASTQWGQAATAAPPANDMWAGMQTVAAQPQAAPAGPQPGQWGAAPAATPAAPQPGGAPAQWQNSGQHPLPQGAPSNGAATGPAGAAPPSPQWGNPAASAQAAPAPMPPASPSAVDPALAAFLSGKQVPAQGMEQGQALMIARTFPDCPPQFMQ